MTAPSPRSRRSRTAAATTPAPEDLVLPGKATINDIARLTGVSKKTVSRVINHSPLVHPETREKVLALMKQLGYGTGYQYEAAEVGRCLRAGEIESPLVPHAVTLEIMGLLDDIRAQIGVSYT